MLNVCVTAVHMHSNQNTAGGALTGAHGACQAVLNQNIALVRCKAVVLEAHFHMRGLLRAAGRQK